MSGGGLFLSLICAAFLGIDTCLEGHVRLGRIAVFIFHLSTIMIAMIVVPFTKF
jgi:hypothetical protein